MARYSGKMLNIFRPSQLKNFTFFIFPYWKLPIRTKQCALTKRRSILVTMQWHALDFREALSFDVWFTFPKFCIFPIISASCCLKLLRLLYLHTYYISQLAKLVHCFQRFWLKISIHIVVTDSTLDCSRFYGCIARIQFVNARHRHIKVNLRLFAWTAWASVHSWSFYDLSLNQQPNRI